MPELNPYEPPQSHATSRATASDPTATPGSKRLLIFIIFLIWLQVISAFLTCFYWLLQAVSHNDISQLQATAAMFGQITMLLGMILILLGYVRRSIGLMLVEFLVLAVAIGLMLIHYFPEPGMFIPG